MIVRTSAMTAVPPPLALTYMYLENSFRKLTNKGQPSELELCHGQDSHGNPQRGLDVHGEPEEATIRSVDDLGSRLAALKHPLRFAGGRIDLVPPAQTNQATASNVLEVVKVGREEQDGDDEDHDPSRVNKQLFPFALQALSLHASRKPKAEEIYQDAR